MEITAVSRNNHLIKLFLILILSSFLLACGDNTAIVAPAGTQPTTAATSSAGATGSTIAATGNITSGCANTYDANKDYFPEKTTLKYTTNLKVEYFKNYKVITVSNPWRDSKVTYQYVLVQCGTPAPTGFEKAQVVQVPVHNLVSMSTSYVHHIEKLGLFDNLVGFGGVKNVTNTTIRKKADDGKLPDMGSVTTPNIEQLLNLSPDLVISSFTSADSDKSFERLKEAGKTTVGVMADYMENTPLARSEWLKFTATFFNLEGNADKEFTGIANRYETLVQNVRNVKTKPTVLSGLVSKGTWYVPGGGSYFARFLADAGANYLWAEDTSTGSVPLSFEAVFDKAGKADFWINNLMTLKWRTFPQIQEEDARFADFNAFKTKQIWNNDAKVNAMGGNDYWEGGNGNPDVILSDLVKIFHPELLPSYQPVYYRQVSDQ